MLKHKSDSKPTIPKQNTDPEPVIPEPKSDPEPASELDLKPWLKVYVEEEPKLVPESNLKLELS